MNRPNFTLQPLYLRSVPSSRRILFSFNNKSSSKPSPPETDALADRLTKLESSVKSQRVEVPVEPEDQSRLWRDILQLRYLQDLLEHKKFDSKGTADPTPVPVPNEVCSCIPCCKKTISSSDLDTPVPTICVCGISKSGTLLNPGNLELDAESTIQD